MNTDHKKHLFGLLALSSLLVLALSARGEAQVVSGGRIVSGGQIYQIDVEVGQVFPVPKTDGGRDDDGGGLTTDHAALRPGQMFSVFVGTPQGIPLFVLHIGEVPAADEPPFMLELDAIEDAGLALFFQSRGVTARLNGRTGDGRGVGKKDGTPLVGGSDSSETAEAGSVRRRAGTATGATTSRRRGAPGGTVSRRRAGPIRTQRGSGTDDLLVLSISSRIRLLHLGRGEVLSTTPTEE